MKPHRLCSFARGRATSARFRTMSPATTRTMMPRVQRVPLKIRSPRFPEPERPASVSADATVDAAASAMAGLLLGTDLRAVDGQGIDRLENSFLHLARQRRVVERGGHLLAVAEGPAQEGDDRLPLRRVLGVLVDQQ